MSLEEQFQDIVCHTFFPRKLPSNEPLHLDQLHHNLLWFINETLSSEFKEEFPKTCKLFTTWQVSQFNNLYDLDQPDSISAAIMEMKNGDMIALYIQAQNAGLILAAENEDIMTVAGFQASCKSKSVMSSASELLVDYPEKCVKIYKSQMLNSGYFSEFLRFIMKFPADIAYEKTRKAGSEMPEQRDVLDPMVVTDFIISVLTTGESETDTNFPRIQKKVRDDVIHGNQTLPFRRSGGWMTMKVAMQLSLLREAEDEEEGRIAYKRIMICLLSEILNRFQKQFPQGEWDLKMQMIAKIARRLEKIKLMNFHDPILQTKITDYLKNIRGAIDHQWRITSTTNDFETKTISSRQVEIDTLQYLDVLKNEIQKREQIRSLRPPEFSEPPLTSCPKRLCFEEFPNFQELFKDQGHVTDFELSELENWIRFNLDRCENEKFCDHIKNLCVSYASRAITHYAEDPVSYSKFVLVVLKCVQVLDKIAVNKFPILKEHKSGVDIACIQQLLLRTRSEMQWGQELEEYFQRRDAIAKYPSLICEETPGNNSFAIRFASLSDEMEVLRQKILAISEKRILEKLEEVRIAKVEVAELRGRITPMICEYKNCWSRYKRIYEMKHSFQCSKCLLQKVLNARLTSVTPYERPLLEEECSQKAVVFELLAPNPIVCLRDILHFFQSDILNKNFLNNSTNIRINWISYGGLSAHQNAVVQGNVKLGSTRNPSSLTMSVDYPAESFILNNGLSMMYNGIPTLPSRGDLGTRCTFKIASQEKSYEGMQWAINNTNHTSNEVIAKQSECPKDLLTAEFIQFGSLRAGNLLQYRNIVMSLVSGKLSLKSEAVFALLTQAMWQTGPTNDNGWVRDAHMDPTDVAFSTELLDIVDKLVNSNEKCWSDPYTLCSLVAIASRVLELTDSVNLKRRSAQVMKKCRNFAASWIHELEELVIKAMSISESSVDTVSELKLRIVLAAFVAVASFSVSSTLVHYVMSDKDDLSLWLFAISTLQNELLWNLDECMKDIKLTKIQRVLARLAMNTSVMLEPSIIEIISSTPRILNGFSKFRWKSADTDKPSWTWTSCTFPHQQIFRCMTACSKNDVDGEHAVYIDVLMGKFLVDGCPIGKLPELIREHKEFRRVFGATEFQVQPNKHGSNLTFTTTTEYHNCSYSFQIQNEILIVREFNENSTSKMLELLPHEAFDMMLPAAFQENYSHWWDSDGRKVLFRSKDFKYEGFSNDISHTLDLSTHILTKSGDKLYQLISMQSNTFIYLTRILSNIEPKNLIHAWVTPKNPSGSISLEVELTRLGLKFNASSEGVLKSQEFPGMHVDSNQDFGTLIGLQHKLVLIGESPIFDRNRKIIVPHSQINSSLLNQSHQTVSIALDNLRHPKMFVYEKDERLQLLFAGRNESAWLYLAALHAFTASPLPDPFTGLTGTEMAFQILQSARVWSCKPYDEFSLNILGNIQLAIPRRVFHPSHSQVQQRIQWPKGLPSAAAHEGFLIIVDKLLKDSHKLDAIRPVKGNFDEDESECKVVKDSSKITTLQLNEKHYWRHTNYLNELSIISQKFEIRTAPNCSIYNRNSLLSDSENKTKNIRLIAHLCHFWTCEFHNWMIYFLSDLLLTCSPLTGPVVRITYRIELTEYFQESTQLTSFRNNWFDLYRFALEVGENENLRPEWQMLLSAMLFHGVPINGILMLQMVAVNASILKGVVPPSYPSYSDPTSQFSKYSLQSEIEKCAESYIGNCFNTDQQELEAKEKHDKECKLQTEEICNYVCQQWNNGPTESVVIIRGYSKVNRDNAEKAVNALLGPWYRNTQLRKFVTDFEIKCLHLVANGNASFTNINPLQPRSPCIANKSEKIRKDLQSIIDNTYVNSNMEAKQIYQNNSRFYRTKGYNTTKQFSSHLELLKTVSGKIWKNLIQSLISDGNDALIAAGLYPRLMPQILLPVILQQQNLTQQFKNVQEIIGAICVLWTYEQKMIRCINYLTAGQSMEVALDREKETDGQRSWIPMEYPGWLLLELELNMMIRPIQLKVAREMMNPTSCKNTVMQLNMGEGKTTLIVPMLAVAFANGKQLCRVTVIKSIFETNFNSLRHTLGGLLNQRVYSTPCRRDADIISATSEIMESFEECTSKRGIVVTLPEHRLSFQLKGYEIAGTNSTAANKILRIQNWLDRNARDILDESDEILYVKYQLVYTIGKNKHLDGGDLRWKTCQKILKRLPSALRRLKETHGHSAVELEEKDELNPAIFPSCRLLQAKIYQELTNILADDFLNGKILTFPSLTEKDGQRQLIKKFLTDNNITSEEIEMVFESFSDDYRNLEIILIMAGYLRFGILEAASVKRWRVNYGVNVKNGFLNMAVPFKAKDVASEKTEFGHPDMAIILTQLSYYYSGLNDKQIIECFDLLKKIGRLSAAAKYTSWIQDIPQEKIDASVKDYNGINLADYTQRKVLFDMLRNTMPIIDFWLSNCVYPKESKQFRWKMTCTPWDLVSENKKLLTTGFSGTNDTQNLLPLQIRQNDLPELNETNRNLEIVLLDPANDSYKALRSGTHSRDIIANLEQEQIKVLLDCGALLLEMSNEEVAETWLEIDNSLEAVVFFSKKNVLTVKTRGSKDSEFELSPFREMMEKCGVYLDDEHTRGTDLKFPKGTKACVTLGSGLTRDKMVQACMRMRMLESKCHTVTFWASHEVDNKIRELAQCGNQCGSKDVLQWVKFNSRKFEEDGLIYWSVAAVNYCLKQKAEKIFYQGNNDLYKLSTQCNEKEIIELQEMYGHSRQMQLFSSIVPRWFESVKTSLGIVESEDIDRTKNLVLSHLSKIIPEKKFYSQLLDEEQEKELEFEIEQEQQKEPAPKAYPLAHHCSDSLVIALLRGQIIPEDHKGLFPIANCFNGTSVEKIVQIKCWGDDVFVTRDFVDTIFTLGLHEGDRSAFLRPVNFVVKMSFQQQLLVISPFEANMLINRFRNGEFQSRLHLYVPRHLSLKTQDILLRNPALCLPTVNVNVGRIEISNAILAPLSLAAGNLYFGDENEQQAFASFLALEPRPWNEQIKLAFERGFINKTNGFVEPKYRMMMETFIKKEAFEINPQELVSEIMRIRLEGAFPEDSQVAILIQSGMKSIANKTNN